MENKAASGIMLIMLLVSILTLAFHVQHVKATGTIYIRADGSIDPPTAPIISSDKINYIFISNIFDSIIVERNNIIVDGSGYTIQGSGSGNGIDVSRRTNVTIRNMEIRAFRNGIFAQFTTYMKIIGNRIGANYDGICFWAANLYSNVTQNTFSDNSQGIEMVDTHLFSVSQNNITNNGDGIALRMSGGSILRNNITSNSVGIDQDASSATISGNNIINNSYGIYLYDSDGNKIGENNIINNGYGIYVWFMSANNEITGNNITSNNNCGICIRGVSAGATSSNTISANIVTENNIGIWLSAYSPGNTITENNITKNYYGMQVNAMTSDSLIYHNNFLNNTIQVQVNPPYPGDDYRYPTWDNGYPSGGNFWSDYVGVDIKSGPNQDQLGSDGIGDTPYLIDEYNQDNYPIVPYGFDRIPPTTIDDYDGLWHNSDFYITLTADDVGTGVAVTYYIINEGATKTVSADGPPLITAESANNKLDYWSVDNAGNQESHHTLWEIKLDKTAPVASAGLEQTIYEGDSVAFDGSGSSDNFGITSYVWTFIDVTPQTLTGVSPAYTFNSAGSYTVTLTVSDAAGNHANDMVTISVLGLSSQERIQRLIETIETWNLPSGTQNGLTSKLYDALHLLDTGNAHGAIQNLLVFIDKVEAVREKKLTNEQANYLISTAQSIIDQIRESIP